MDGLEQALIHHQQGRLAEAETLYRAILLTQSSNAEVLRLLGVLTIQKGDAEGGLEWIEKSLALNPMQPLTLLNSGSALQALGRWDEALERYERALRLDPNLVPAMSCCASVLLQLRRPAEALSSADRALRIDPHSAPAHETRGTALLELRRYEEALASYDRVLQLDPNHAIVLNNRGNALLALGRPADALAQYDRALQINPAYARALMHRASALLDLGQPQAGLASIDIALQLEPNSAAAHNNRGNLLIELKRVPEALVSFERALSLQPSFALAHNGRSSALLQLDRAAEALASAECAARSEPELEVAHYNRALALQRLGRLEDALTAYDRALQLRPSYGDAWNNRGEVLLQLHRAHEALASFERARSFAPQSVEAHNNCGLALTELNRNEEALERYETALRLRPGFAPALNNIAILMAVRQRHEEAARYFSQLLSVAPDFPYARGDLLHSRLHCCDWTDFEAQAQAIAAAVQCGTPVIDPFSFLAIAETAAAQLQCARLFAQHKFPPVNPPLWSGERYRHSKIRVAYLSADFQNHATANLAAGLFEAHDRERFEVLAVSFGPNDGSPMRARLERAFDRFSDVRASSDREVARQLREWEVDIAVDLKGYTSGSRPGILAHRPAPVHVNYLGYPGTLGASYIDYIVADRHVLPREDQRHYAEKVVYLPDCYQINDRKRAVATVLPSRRDLGLPETGLVFCCFNGSYKITPAMYDIWMRLLRTTSGSVLWLLDDSGAAKQNLRQEAIRRGVQAERLIFAPRLPAAEHLARYSAADLFIDTAPINAHTTASDALWAGLPVLTLQGATFASRVAASLLCAVDLPELVCHTFASYEETALRLASALGELSGLRERLNQNRLNCPLFDTERTCRALEGAYLRMWERAQSGESAASFAVQLGAAGSSPSAGP